VKRKIACLIFATSLVSIPLALSTGCSSANHEAAGYHAKDKDIAARVKTKLSTDPLVKGTDVKVTAVNGVVQLSGFVDSQEAKDRASQIASSTAGVEQVYNNLLLPTGRTNTPSP
jgi:osmotically-inducible protein OsmY